MNWLISVYYCLGTYKLGEIGVDACPSNAKVITNPTKCAEAAQALGYDWDEAAGTKTGTLVCNYCTGCTPNIVLLSSSHGDLAYWMCEKTAGNVLFLFID